uniref:RING-type domain-containing protein n=1 Tax=Sinocyclocheilus grahami TaxID=75366 RepID=A0A672QFK7_SINGR
MDMASSGALLAEELHCSICLDVFTDPVSTPCGHNFCKSCLSQCWDSSQTCKCPYCKEGSYYAFVHFYISLLVSKIKNTKSFYCEVVIHIPDPDTANPELFLSDDRSEAWRH